MEVPQKIKNRVTKWSSSPTPGHVQSQNYNSIRYMHSDGHSSPVYNNQDMAATLVFIDRWMDKEHEVYVCVYSEILLTCKKELNNTICGNMDGLRNYHTKWSKSDKDKYHVLLKSYHYLHWNLKMIQWIYSQNRNRLPDIESILWLPKEKVGR